MKKQFLSFVMMLALVIVAGTAMAQTPGTNNYPYMGGTYSYTLGDIVVNATGDAKITHAQTGWTIVDVQGAGANTIYTPGTAIAITSGAPRTLAFKIKFADSGATTGKLTVTVTDGNGCNNFIELLITPQAKPTLELAIAGSVVDLCQERKDAPLTDNKDAVTDGGTANTNTFTFDVTPTIENVATGATYSYEYAISIDDLVSTFTQGFTISPAAGTITHTNVTAPVTDTYTITFVSKSGISPQDVNAALSNAKLTVPTTSGTVEATGTYSAQDDKVIIKSIPSIGSFTIE